MNVIACQSNDQEMCLVYKSVIKQSKKNPVFTEAIKDWIVHNTTPSSNINNTIKVRINNEYEDHVIH